MFWLIPDESTTPSSRNHAPAGVSQTQERLSLNLFHQRLGHASEDVCLTLAKDLGIILLGKSLACAVCARAKMKKKAITSLAASPAVPTAPGQCIYLDIKGPLEHVAYNGDKYAFVYVDEATRITIVKTATTKDKIVAMTASALDGFSTFPLTSIPVGRGTTLHSDSEAVIQSNAMKEMLARRKISFRTSPPKTQEINGIVERSIQTLLNSARCLLTEANMPNQYWTLALQHACYLKNYLPTASLGNKSPIQVLTGMDKRIDHLRIFGSAAYVKIDEQIREALGPKARKGLYVGHSDTAGCSRVLLLDRVKTVVVNSFHCLIHENEKPYSALADERTVMLRQHEEQRQNIGPKSCAPTATASSNSLPVTSIMTNSITLNSVIDQVVRVQNANAMHASHLHGFVDASWAEDIDTSYSQSGYVIFIWQCYFLLKFSSPTSYYFVIYPFPSKYKIYNNDS